MSPSSEPALPNATVSDEEEPSMASPAQVTETRDHPHRHCSHTLESLLREASEHLFYLEIRILDLCVFSSCTSLPACSLLQELTVRMTANSQHREENRGPE